MSHSRFSSVFAATLLIAVAACGGSSRPAAEPSGGEADDVAEATPPGDVAQVGAGEDEDESTADLAEHHRHHHHGGFAMFIAMSLDSLNTTPEQASVIAQVRTDMRGAMASAHDAEQAVLLALADGIAANQIDQPRLDAAIDRLSTAVATVQEASAGSLGALHAALTPPQRAALADKVEAHFEVWQHTNSPGDAERRDHRGGQLARLANELGLSPQQVDTIRANFASSRSSVPQFDRAEGDAHIKAFTDAFESDTFDPRALSSGGPVNVHMATWGVARTVRLYEAVLPVLTPEQRARLAESVRRHANYQPDGMPS